MEEQIFDFSQALKTLTPPYVSVVVPVHGTEKLLARCLDSLVYQTLKPIEIILVNDASPDGAQAVMDKYAARFPETVRCLRHPEKRGPAMARKTGFEAAKAPYVAFVDAEDFVSSVYCETALSQALQSQADVVCLNVFGCTMDGRDRSRPLIPAAVDRGQLITRVPSAFGTGFYRKEFLAGQDAFVPMYFDGDAVTASLFAAAERFAVVERRLVFHEVDRPDGMNSRIMDPEKQTDLLRADRVLWTRAPEQWKREFAVRIARRILSLYEQYPALAREIPAHAREMLPELRPWLPREDQSPEAKVTENLEKLAALPEKCRIPGVVYMNGFGEDPAPRKARMEAAGFTCRVLDGTNCDVSTLPGRIREKAEAGDWTQAGAWFGLKRILEEGGMYAGEHLEIFASINRNRLEDRIFFTAMGDHKVSPYFFGAVAGAPMVKAVLDAVKEDSDLRETMSRVLYVNACVSLSGREETACGVHILPMSRTWLQTENPVCRMSAGDPELILVPQSIKAGQGSGDKETAYAILRGRMNRVHESYLRVCDDRDSIRDLLKSYEKNPVCRVARVARHPAHAFRRIAEKLKGGK